MGMERLAIAPEGTTKSAQDWHEAPAPEPEGLKALQSLGTILHWEQTMI